MKYEFGQKLRLIRERRQMTMKEVGLKAGISESMISQIERNKVSPAVDTLLNIAEVLEIDLEFLFSDIKKDKSLQLVRKEERNKIVSPGITYEQLTRSFKINQEHELEAYYVEIEPDGEKGSVDYGHIGKELGIILSGKGEIVYGTQTFSLSPGDSITFDSDIPHRLRNTGKTPLKTIWVITPPKWILKNHT